MEHIYIQKKAEKQRRKKEIMSVCCVNIVVTLILATVKIVLGFISHSPTLILDAVNYYMDILLAGIVMVGTHYSGKEPDKEHPFGYGRAEYVAGLYFSFLTATVGIDSVGTAIYGFFEKTEPSYSISTVIIVVVTIVLKLFVGDLTKKVGKQEKADALTALGNGSVRKVIFSLLAVFEAIIVILGGPNLDKYLALILAFFLLRAAWRLFRKTASEIFGKRLTPELVRDVKNTIASFENVIGAYDLVLHNYGHDELMGSVHIEIPENMRAREIDILTRHIHEKVLEKHRVELKGIGIYAVDDIHSRNADQKNHMLEIVKQQGAIGLHGFYLNEEERELSFDVLYSIEDEERHDKLEQIQEFLKDKFPDYKIDLNMDVSIS